MNEPRRTIADVLSEPLSVRLEFMANEMERVACLAKDQGYVDIAEGNRAIGKTMRDALNQIAGHQLDIRSLCLAWGLNGKRDPKRDHVEWHAPCGCAYHPEGDQGPHVHPCPTHESERAS